MKMPLLFVCSMCLSVVSMIFADESAFEIGVWGDFCGGAFTHTFDDNTPNQITVAQPLFDAKEFHMTLFTITGSSQFPVNWEDMKNASARGHEIASHSVTHQQTMSDAGLATSSYRSGRFRNHCVHNRRLQVVFKKVDAVIFIFRRCA